MTLTNQPCVSVLMPVYNAEMFLQKSIESVLNQTFIDFELIIINDGSTDSSEHIILQFSDSRIKYIKNEFNLKLIQTLNKGMKLARGKYLVRMDSDDICELERFQIQVNFMDRNPEIVVSGTWFKLFGNSAQLVQYPIEHDAIVTNLLYTCCICHPSTIWRLEKLDKIAFDENYAHAEDYHFWINCLEIGKIANIPQSLLNYRVHGDSVSIKYSEIQKDNSLKIRRLLFGRMGLDVSVEQLVAFEAFCTSNWAYFDRLSKLSTMSMFIVVLVTSNQKSRLIDENYFETFLAEKWLHLNLNCGSKVIYERCEIAKKISLTLKLKMDIKSFLRKKSD